MRPFPGILPPKARVKITPSPPIGPDERPTFVTDTRKTPRPATMTDCGDGSVIVENHTDVFTPYCVFVVNAKNHDTASTLYQLFKNQFLGK